MTDSRPRLIDRLTHRAYNEHRPYPANSRRMAVLNKTNAETGESDGARRTRENRNAAKAERKARRRGRK
jgi:hypothetical protein